MPFYSPLGLCGVRPQNVSAGFSNSQHSTGSLADSTDRDADRALGEFQSCSELAVQPPYEDMSTSLNFQCTESASCACLRTICQYTVECRRKGVVTHLNGEVNCRENVFLGE